MEQTQTTAAYKLALAIGPAEKMLMAEEAAGATSGEFMVQMAAMPAHMPNTGDASPSTPLAAWVVGAILVGGDWGAGAACSGGAFAPAGRRRTTAARAATEER